MNEAEKATKLIQELRKIPNSKWIKMVQFGRVSEAGTPDIMGSVCGRTIFVECKLEGNDKTEIQKLRESEWREAGALVYNVWFNKDNSISVESANFWNEQKHFNWLRNHINEFINLIRRTE